MWFLGRGKRHAHIHELKLDRQSDLSRFGQDPFVNLKKEEEKYIIDMKIVRQAHQKHQLSDFDDSNTDNVLEPIKNILNNTNVKSDDRYTEHSQDYERIN